jgi:hypothetical protein
LTNNQDSDSDSGPDSGSGPDFGPDSGSGPDFGSGSGLLLTQPFMVASYLPVTIDWISHFY